jgi:bifunctional non-homologous end joining protein LigD
LAVSELAEYEAKRDFAKTDEPSGRRKVAASTRLRFVIQKHDASRLHYDFRLEADGVFKSWAVTKGPSLDPHDKRLAIEVEDHPLDYGDFEGTIPKSEYGGGTVQLWDRGYWEPEGGADPAAALRKGELKFRLDGRRLRGSSVLVRMRSDRFKSKRNSWLLIKHRDEFARPGDDDALLDDDRSVASGRTMAVIAARKGHAPRSFIDEARQSQSNAAWNSHNAASTEKPAPRNRGKRAPSRKPKEAQAGRVHELPDFVAPQLCTLIERPPAETGWGHEVKFDGYRIQMRIEDHGVALRTRKGLDWTEKFPAIAGAAEKLPDCIIDGEIVALDRNGAPDFAALQAAIADRKTDQLIFFAFDLLRLRSSVRRTRGFARFPAQRPQSEAASPASRS